MKDQEPTKRSPKNAIAPDEREKERQRKLDALEQKNDPTSLEQYLKEVNFEDLLLLKSEIKSSKKLETGPMIAG